MVKKIFYTNNKIRYVCIGHPVYLNYTVLINAERYVWHSQSASTFHSVRMLGRVIKDMFSLYRHLSEVELPRFIWHRVTINFDSSRITSLLSMICTQASFFDPCRFTYDRPIRRYCKTKMKYLRLSFYSMNYQGRYRHCPRLIDARRARGNPYWYSRTNNFDSTVAGKGLSSTLTFDGHLEILHHSPLPLDSRCYCHRRCCTLCHLSLVESC